MSSRPPRAPADHLKPPRGAARLARDRAIARDRAALLSILREARPPGLDRFQLIQEYLRRSPRGQIQRFGAILRDLLREQVVTRDRPDPDALERFRLASAARPPAA